MRFCEDHWGRLRAAIEERGLTILVSEDGEAAMNSMVSELQGGVTIDNFDPLMRAHWAIASNAMEVAGDRGIELMKPPEGGEDVCPLCFVNKENPYGFNYDVWIDCAADDQLDKWRELQP